MAKILQSERARADKQRSCQEPSDGFWNKIFESQGIKLTAKQKKCKHHFDIQSSYNKTTHCSTQQVFCKKCKLSIYRTEEITTTWGNWTKISKIRKCK